MIQNYLKIFFRNLWKHPGFTISNLSSLAVGMTTCILITLFVRHELNWNTYNKNYDRTYRVQQKIIFKNDIHFKRQTGFQLASQLKKQIPEIDNSTTTNYIYGEHLSSSDKLTFQEKNGCYADNNIFKVLTFEFIQGDPETALSDPFSVVITKNIADKYFPGENPFGKIIKSTKNKSLKVTGVIKNLPFDLDYRPDYLVSMPTYREVADSKDYDKIENISSSSFYTLVTLKQNVSVKLVNEKIYNFSDKYVVNNTRKLYLKPFSELHLVANEKKDVRVALYYIGAFAFFVLMLACINFINLSTANSFLRKNEIGIRKVVGASRISLFIQFIGESVLFSFIAMIFSFLLVELLLPTFNIIVSRHIELSYVRDINFILLMIVVFFVTGILSGIYPALYISSFRPVHVLKGDLSVFNQSPKGSSKSFLRKSLVASQFCISISLLMGTVFVIKQVHFMKTKELGFVKDDLLICNVYGSNKDVRFETLRNELLNNPDVLNASFSDGAPFNGERGKEINWEGTSSTEKINASFYEVSYDFLDTYKMKILSGRNFARNYSTDDKACLINETAKKTFEWNDPIGKRIDSNKYSIIGVVKDFHPFTVHEKIPPFYFVLKSNDIKSGGVYSIRIKPYDKEKTADYVREKFKSYFPDAIIEVTTFDNKMDFGTKGVWETIEKLFIGFSVIAIFIAANGLFGMISFASQRRLKEIGVRKVFGASNSQLYLLISKEFAFILIIAAFIAVPSGIIFSNSTPGAYKYQLQFLDYFLSIGLMVLTALLATVYHTTKAILSNPVESLRYE